MEAVGSERVDRNIVARADPSVPVVECDARRETRLILQTPLVLVARAATLPTGEKLTWTLTCVPTSRLDHREIQLQGIVEHGASHTWRLDARLARHRWRRACVER